MSILISIAMAPQSLAAIAVVVVVSPLPAVIVAAPAGSLIWVETRFEPALQPTSGPTSSRDAVVDVCWMSGEMSNLVTWR